MLARRRHHVALSETSASFISDVAYIRRLWPCTLLQSSYFGFGPSSVGCSARFLRSAAIMINAGRMPSLAVSAYSNDAIGKPVHTAVTNYLSESNLVAAGKTFITKKHRYSCHRRLYHPSPTVSMNPTSARHHKLNPSNLHCSYNLFIDIEMPGHPSETGGY